MDDIIRSIVIVLIIWLIIFILIVLKKLYLGRKDVNNVFLDLDSLLKKRLEIIIEMISIIKNNIRKESKKFSNYDIEEYLNLSVNDKLSFNIKIEAVVNRLLLISSVYPEINSNIKYCKLEKELGRLNKRIKKMKVKYNKSLSIFIKMTECFPGIIFSLFFRSKSYKFYE